MNITTKSRYALRAVVDIAQHQGENGCPVRRVDIGGREGFSQDYLEQLLVKLREEGIVEAVRGPGGGYRLLKEAHDITVWDIVQTVESKLGYTPCSNDNVDDCDRFDKCQCKDIWLRLKHVVIQELRSISVADIISGKFFM
jgi:Rrf2 family iron-sulfur cluster assembly transcriptional regulator